jgi:Ca2+-binding EF-hand superfamily protein
MVSSMTPLEKLTFVFTCYDFDESGSLTLDEMTLSLKSTITGLCKISGGTPPGLAEFEAIAGLAFQACDKEPAGSIESKEFLK